MGPFIFYREAFSDGCTRVHPLYEFKLILQMSHPPILSIWQQFASCTSYVWTYIQFQNVCTYVLWDTFELWLYACKENLRIEIEVTNVPCTISIRLVVIRILYSRCTDVQAISNGLYICNVGNLGTMAARLYRNCTNRDFGHKYSMHLLNPFGSISDPVLLMYVRTANFKYFELAMYGSIHFVLGST